MRGSITKEMYGCVPEIDFYSGSRYFLDNMDNYARALMATLKSTKSKLPLIQSMYLSEEYEGLRTIAQTLQKMLHNIGAVNLVEETYQLELTLLSEDNSELQLQLSTYMLHLMVFSEHLEELFCMMEITNNHNREETNSSFLNYDFSKTKESIRQSSDLLERKVI